MINGTPLKISSYDKLTFEVQLDDDTRAKSRPFSLINSTEVISAIQDSPSDRKLTLRLLDHSASLMQVLLPLVTQNSMFAFRLESTKGIYEFNCRILSGKQLSIRSLFELIVDRVALLEGSATTDKC